MEDGNVLYYGTDADGDEIQIVSFNNGATILRVRNNEDDTSCGVILDYEMMSKISSVLVATMMVLAIMGPSGEETLQ
jgi:hypothetical protein